MSKQLVRRFRRECCDSPFRDDPKRSREKSASIDNLETVRPSPIVAPIDIVSTWRNRYRFDAHSLN
jgi:hypothetical protein